jgi:predicted flap endonuclease-1-like 5' DNA nuclease
MVCSGGGLLGIPAMRLGLLSWSYAPLAAKTEGTPWWMWLLILAAIVLFVAILVWWWVRTHDEEGAPTLPQQSPPVRVKAPPRGDPLASPPVDDLTRIEGIGPRICSVLQAAGIPTFARLASTEVESLRQVLEEADPRLLRLADPSSWPEQAKLAAEGAWDALQALQDELKGGRRV